MTPEQHNRYIKGKYDPRYPHDFGWLHIFGIVGVFLLFLAFITALNWWASLPDVYFSYSMNECVKVINYKITDEYTCDDLPTKYHHYWSE